MVQIWLDDYRDPKDHGYPDALWCKTYEEWLDFTELNGNPFDQVEYIHLDHDLGTENTGYNALVDIECMLVDGWWKCLKRIYIHTSNPSAANKMMLAKESMARYGVQMVRKHY